MWTNQDLGCPGLACATVVVSAVPHTASPEEQPFDFWYGKALDVLQGEETALQPCLAPCKSPICHLHGSLSARTVFIDLAGIALQQHGM